MQTHAQAQLCTHMHALAQANTCIGVHSKCLNAGLCLHVSGLGVGNTGLGVIPLEAPSLSRLLPMCTGQVTKSTGSTIPAESSLFLNTAVLLPKYYAPNLLSADHQHRANQG